MSCSKDEYKKHFSSQSPRKLPDPFGRLLVSLVGLLSLCIVSVMYGSIQTKTIIRRHSPPRIRRVGDNFKKVLNVTRDTRHSLSVVMGQAVYDLGPGNAASVVVPEDLTLLRSSYRYKRKRRKNVRINPEAIERLSGRKPIVVNYDPRLDDDRLERFSRSARLRKYPLGIFALREPDAKPDNQWVFVSSKNGRRIYLVPLSMVPEAQR